MSEKEPYQKILVIHRFDNLFKNREGMFKSIDSDGKEHITKLPGPPDYDIICDGCNDMIDTDHVNALSFSKDSIHSIQCDACVKKYFSDFPKENMLDPMAFINKALYHLKGMDILKNTPSTFYNLKEWTERALNQFIEEIKG